LYSATSITAGTCLSCSDALIKTKGYICKDGANTLCPAGYHCPLNSTTNSYNTQIPCDEEGKICFPGFIEPVDCREGQSCEANATQIKQSWGALVAMGFLAFVCCCLCCCVCFYNVKEKRTAEQYRTKLDEQIASGEKGEGHSIGEEFKKFCPPVEISFEDVGMTLRTSGKKILDGVTGYFPPGALIALMGPSGGGKTTFMNALLGRASYAHVQGLIKVNGVDDGFAKARNIMGFVPQDDILHADLTVEQNLTYQALLRLPGDVSELEVGSRPLDAAAKGLQRDCKLYCQECSGGVCCSSGDTSRDRKQLHVEEVLRVLGIDHIAHEIVGTPENRGISGGQKKRVNIGMELAAMPSIIFMDEPTSGLDGAATLELAQCLVKLQQAGLTICCVIHQPRMSVFKSFSHLLLLGKGGRQVYCGRTEYLKDYLTELNFCMPPDENPADWMIDVVCGLDNAKKYRTLEARQRAAAAFAEGMEVEVYNKENAGDIDEGFECPEGLFMAWEEGHKAGCMDKESRWMKPKNGAKHTPTDDGAAVAPLVSREVPGYCSQFATLFRRTFRQFSLQTFGGTAFGIYIAFYAMYGLIPYPGYNYDTIYMTGRNGTLFALIMAAIGRRVFGDDSLIYYRECKTGISATAYWFSKSLVSIIEGYLYALTYTMAVYWTSIPMQKFDDMMDMNFYYYWYWGGMAQLLSVSFSSQASVTLILVLWPMLEPIYSGGIPALTGEISEMSGFMDAWSSLSCGRWTAQLYFAAELDALPDHVRHFSSISTQLQNAAICKEHQIMAEPSECDLAQKANEAKAWLLCLGLTWRLWTWMLLALVKHAQGHGCFRDMLFVLSSTVYSWCECCGVVGLFQPDEKDVVISNDDHHMRMSSGPPPESDKAKLTTGADPATPDGGVKKTGLPMQPLNSDSGTNTGSGSGADVEAGRSCDVVARSC